MSVSIVAKSVVDTVSNGVLDGSGEGSSVEETVVTTVEVNEEKVSGTSVTNASDVSIANDVESSVVGTASGGVLDLSSESSPVGRSLVLAVMMPEI